MNSGNWSLISKPSTKWQFIEIIGPGTALEVSVLYFTFNNFFNLNNTHLEILHLYCRESVVSNFTKY